MSNKYILNFSHDSVIKNSHANAGDVGDEGVIPGSGWTPGGGNGNPLQYPCLENPMDREKPGGLQSMESQRAGHDWATEHAQHKKQIYEMISI